MELKNLLAAARITLCAESWPSEQMREQSHREEEDSRELMEEVRDVVKLLFVR